MSPGGASAAVRRRLDGGRWHFQHGPIDCIVAADGDAGAVGAAVESAWARFRTILAELVAELPLLRADLSASLAAPSPANVAPGMPTEVAARCAPAGAVARRMVAACRPHAENGRFITAMAAVAGSVAEELIAAFARPGVARASVNNGGDIALHLAPGQSFAVGVVSDPARGIAGLPPDGCFAVDAASPVRGIATSGWRGRSFSLGIADSVTVLAPTASVADAAATIVANAVDADDPRILRVPASAVRDDSDLGDRLVTRAVPPLPAGAVDAALARGAAEAQTQIAAGRIVAAVLTLQGRWAVVGDRALAPAPAAPSRPAHPELAC